MEQIEKEYRQDLEDEDPFASDCELAESSDSEETELS